MSKDEVHEIQIKVIIEIIGTPKEHVLNTLNLVSENISKNYKVISKDIREPVKHTEKFFSSFIEIEFIVPNFSELIGFIIDFHPSSVEIIEPEEIKESAQSLTFVLNDFISKIHRMDIQIKTLMAKNKLLEKEMEKA